MYHYTLDDVYLRRNPNFTPPPVKKQVSIAPGAAPVFPRSKTLTRFNDFSMANRFTSACSPIIYRDHLLGDEYYGNSFVCEPVHNLVHREIVEPQGTTFTSHRAADERQSEFLASEDSWFRPSMCRTGPDGALWISDMYRFVIEHPKWIPDAAQKRVELRAGEDKGRIYRVYAEGKEPRPIARLDKANTAGLVAALDSPNGPQRDLAQQMLIWRGDKSSIDPLRKLATEATRPQTRLEALCTLDGLGALTEGDVRRALGDQHPGVRRQAIRLAESRLAGAPALVPAVLKLVDDVDPQVQMQLAYTLGSCPGAAGALAAMLARQAADPYITAAAFSSVSKANVAAVLSETLKRDGDAPPAALVERLLAMAAAMGEDVAVGKALRAVSMPRDGKYAAWQFAALAEVAQALARRGAKLDALLDDQGRQQLIAMLAAARETAAAGNDAPRAVAATAVLARGLDGRTEDDLALLATLLAPQKPPEIRSAAVAALARTGSRQTPALLLAAWPASSPALRSQILDALAGREDWSLALLTAVEEGQILAAQFDARRRQQFTTARSKLVREKAEKVLAGTVDPNRQKLVETYLPAAAGGDRDRGKLVFAKRCANCHRLEAAGYAVGPDLAALASRPADYLLTQILDPNRAVEARYLEYVVLTADGRQQSGMLIEETGASLTLAAQEGKQFVVARSDVEQVKSSGKSLMPEGVEKDVSPAEMADLLAYLKSSTPPPKKVAGNQPEVVGQYVLDSSIRLSPTSARIYGPTLTLEEKYRNLGWWNSQEDYAAWTIEVPAGGEGDYRVTLDYSCADGASGNTAIVEVAGQALAAAVTSTGSWDDFRGMAVGTVKLPAGQSELVVRSSGPVKNALFDLRGVRLVPVK
jgi:putative heme-binding domain-containing protein